MNGNLDVAGMKYAVYLYECLSQLDDRVMQINSKTFPWKLNNDHKNQAGVRIIPPPPTPLLMHVNILTLISVTSLYNENLFKYH